MSEWRIAQVINSIGLGGVPQSVYQLVKHLPRDRYRTFVYVLRNYTDHADVRSETIQRFEDLGVTVRLPLRDEKKFNVVGEIAGWIQQDRPHILHTHSYKPNIYGRLAGIMCHNPELSLVAHYHNYYDNKWAEDDSLIYDQLLAKQTDAIVACSHSVAKHVCERVGIESQAISVISNGVDLQRFAAKIDSATARRELGIEPEVPVLGVVGRISAQKGLDDFIRAAALIHAQQPETQFIIAGAPESPKLLRALQGLTQELGLQDRLRFLGHVADMPQVYAALDLLVLPSRWEGFGLVLAEAMAAGKPVVATNVGGIPEVVADGETGLLVPPAAPGELAEAIIKLLTDPARAARMAEQGRRRAELFSWPYASEQLDVLYYNLLNYKEKISTDSALAATVPHSARLRNSSRIML
jgi:glycosyltransferase involved in cell wall biosynthesis